MLLAWPAMPHRLLATALVAALLLASAGATSAAPTNAEEEATRPEGNAWIVGVVVLVLAVALVTAGRWWVRSRLGRVQR